MAKDLALAALPPSPNIADVTAGPGSLALLAAREGATVSAIDCSPAMIANLRRRADEAGQEMADVRVGDGQSTRSIPSLWVWPSSKPANDAPLVTASASEAVAYPVAGEDCHRIAQQTMPPGPVWAD